MGRTPCCDKTGLKKGPWTPEEDQTLIDYIQKHGPGNWRALPNKAGLKRCGKSCRLQWTNYLRPDIRRGRFSFEEEETIIQLHSVLGNKWSAIAAKLPGRTDNEIKNYWNTHIRKRLLRMGVDPVTHGPRLDLLDLPSMLSSLQNPSLLNMSALLNLQSLVNPDLLRFAASLASSQYGIPYPQRSSENLIVSNGLQQNTIDSNVQSANHVESPIQNIQNLNESQIEPRNFNVGTDKSGFQVNVHVSTDPSLGGYAPDHVKPYPSTTISAFTSSNSNQSFSNNSSLSSVISTPCSSPPNPLDASIVYLNSSTGSEDEIESYFTNILEKLENPCSLLS